MFDIDDALLTKVGYNIAIMTESQKDECKREIQEELNQRVAECFLPKLSEDEIVEFEDVQSNPDRTRRWLEEFHSDYATREDYKAVRQTMDSDEEAMSFYATALWLRYAIPGYHDIMQEIFDDYIGGLIDMRNEVNKQLGLVA